MTPASPGELRELLREAVDAASLGWLDAGVEEVRRDRRALARLLPAVGRHLGRQRLGRSGAPAAPDAPGGAHLHDWTVDDAGRALLLVAAGPGAWDEIEDLYRFGDAAERRGILRSLHLLPLPAGGTAGTSGGRDPIAVGLRLVDDAARTNDSRLLAAALGPFAVARLDERAFNQAVLKCVFVGVPVSGLPGVADRATPGLARMLAAYAHERVAAGRDVPADIWPLVDAHPPHDELAALAAEREHPVPARRAAATAALAQRGHRPPHAEPAEPADPAEPAHRHRHDGGTTCASSSRTST